MVDVRGNRLSGMEDTEQPQFAQSILENEFGAGIESF